MDVLSGKDPPRIAGDVSIARFLSQDAADKWRVCVGHNHFLTDCRTAHRLLALAGDGASRRTYQEIHAACRATEGGLDTIDDLVEWCEAHRTRLEGLADVNDSHALRYRRVLLSARSCELMARSLRGLFQPTVLLASWFAALLVSGLCWLERTPPREPGNFFLAAVIALTGIFLHELGHITACVRHGARQGGIGVGLYWIWPAFYADVRGGWSLGHVQRAVISMGGLYFQSLYLALLCALEMATPSATLSIAAATTVLLMLTTLNPVFKYDGYWILSDLLNLTNLHARIGSHLRELLRSSGPARRRLLHGRMTIVSAGFASMAVTYFGYLLHMLASTVAAQLATIPGLWRTTCHLFGEHVAFFGEAGASVAKLCMTVLGAILLGVAIAVLGYRALQATRKVVGR